MKYKIIYDINKVKSIIFDNDNLLEGMIPEVLDPDGNVPKMDRHCKPDPDAIGILTERKQMFFHIDIFGNGNTMTFELETERVFNCFVLSGLNTHFVGEFEIYAADAREVLYAESNKLFHYVNENNIDAFSKGGAVGILFPMTSARYFGVRILKGSVADDIFRPNYVMLTNAESKACAGTPLDYELTVHTREVVNPKFYGTGGCIIPMHMMPENLALGYNECHLALELAAVKRLKLNIVRLWFQVDWITDNYENYKRGIYTFHSQKFEAVCRFLVALKEAGCKVLLDYGWKTAAPVNEWFGFEHFLKENWRSRWNSAPRELDLFARGCVATLRELVEVRGFDNIAYLTFFNEPNPIGDFQTPFGSVENMQEAYRLNAQWWRKMVDCVDAELRAAGLRGQIALWGPEFAPERGHNGHIPYLRWLEEEDNCPLEVMTYHQYDFHSFEVKEQMRNLRQYTDKPLVIGECGTHNGAMYWDNNQAQTFIDIANAGFSGMNFWVCCGPSRFTTPMRLKAIRDDEYVDSGFGLVRITANNKGRDFTEYVQPVGVAHPLYAMFSHYVPLGSKVLKSGEDYGGLRYAAFETPSGDYTIIVEVKDSAEGGHLCLRFDSSLNRTFYIHEECKEKHYYLKYPTSINGIVPPCCGTTMVDDTLEFDFDGRYGVYCFTTMPSVPQVNIDKEKVILPRGGSEKLNATLMDAEGEIVWSVVAGEGTVDKDGVVTMPMLSIKDDMFAVEARIRGTDTYAVAVVFCA